MDVPTVIGQWAGVITGSIKLGPTALAEIDNTLNVGEKPGGLLPVHPGELALMAHHSPELAWS